MNYVLAIILGAVQGITEFLPISSTGHLIILENFLGISQKDFGLAFDASLHLGTLIAILIFFYKDYLKIFTNSLYIKLIIGTLPAVVLGLTLESYIETSLRQTWIVGLALITFSFVMILAEKMAKKKKSAQSTTFFEALIIGFFQSLALIPGISRSGATISAGLFLGLKRDQAARFAFMLSGPIIAGAGVKKFLDVATGNFPTSDLGFFWVGIASSAFFGYLTIKFFMKYLSFNSLYPFVIYRIVVGFILVVISLIELG